MSEKMPIKPFVYPGGTRMCRDGLVRAAYTGVRILRCEISLADIENMARKGERALNNNADTHKRNLIYLMVYRHGKSGALLDYVNESGYFILNNGHLSNVFAPENLISLNTLLRNGILQD